jgi:hypothetical protein
MRAFLRASASEKTVLLPARGAVSFGIYAEAEWEEPSELEFRF